MHRHSPLKLILVASLMLQFLGMFSSQTVTPVLAGAQVFTCTSIEFFTSDAATTPVTFPLVLGLDADGNQEPMTITVHITAQGPQDFSPTADYQLSYQHQQFSGGAWNWNHVSFEQTLNPGTNEWNSVAHMTFDKVGTWYYSFETTAQRHVDGSGPGCARTDGGRSVLTTVSEPPDPNQSYNRGCTILDEAQAANHFTCEKQGSGETASYSPIASESFCESGFEIANETCTGSTTLTAPTYCLPCLPEDRGGTENTVGHLEICDADHLCNPTLVAADITGARFNLVCLPSTAPVDRGTTGTVSRCRYRGRVQQRTTECLVGSDECRVKDEDNFYALFCEPESTSSFRGGCHIMTESCQAGTNFSDAICVRYFNRLELPDANDAFCNEDTGLCAPGNSREEIEPPVITPIDPPESTEFGAANCPYPSAIAYTSHRESTCSGVCVSSPSCGRYALSGSSGTCSTPSNVCCAGQVSRTPEEEAENLACVACVGEKNTWTALGCINTTVSGVFTALVRISLGIMGGVVLLRMIYLGYLYQTGDTKKIEEAKAGVMSTIAGIIVVVFSVVILRVVGVNLLDIVPSNFFG